jgi:hypothetical protein
VDEKILPALLEIIPQLAFGDCARLAGCQHPDIRTAISQRLMELVSPEKPGQTIAIEADDVTPELADMVIAAHPELADMVIAAHPLTQPKAQNIRESLSQYCRHPERNPVFTVVKNKKSGGAKKIKPFSIQSLLFLVLIKNPISKKWIGWLIQLLVQGEKQVAYAYPLLEALSSESFNAAHIAESHVNQVMSFLKDKPECAYCVSDLLQPLLEMKGVAERDQWLAEQINCLRHSSV